jgi:CubicO group peptidase (beta-lactamase class C family)
MTSRHRRPKIPGNLKRRGTLGLFALMIAPIAPIAAAQSAEAQDGAAVRLTREWLRLCEQPDAAAMTQWLRTNLTEQAQKVFPAADRAEDDAALCAANGGLHVAGHSARETNPVSLPAVGVKTGAWFEVKALVNDAGKLKRFSHFPALPPESALPRELSDAAVARDIKKYIARVSKRGLFSGIVVAARGTKVLASASSGYANRETRTLISAETQFTLGSLGKMFTAAAIGQLVDQKKLSFDDTVGKIFPDYPNQRVRDKVTIGMLLSHTGGMGNFLGKRTAQMMTAGVKRAAEFLPLFDHDEPQFEPGTGWAYSNAGLALAGAIVEKVSGEDYPNYIREHIFAVAGMAHSDPNNIPGKGKVLVTPYTKMTDQGFSPDWHEAEHDIGSPAGGAISTAGDLVRFADALRGGRLLSRATFAEMSKAHGSTPDNGKYGYAMEILDVYGLTAVGHGGGFPGVSTHLYLVLDSPYTVVVLANQDPPADAYVGMKTIALIAEKAKRGE